MKAGVEEGVKKNNQNITIGWRCERSCEKGQEKDMTKSEKM